MSSKKSSTVGVRLQNSTWAALDWVAQNHPEYNRSSSIEAALSTWLEQFDIPANTTACDGQTSLDDIIGE